MRPSRSKVTATVRNKKGDSTYALCKCQCASAQHAFFCFNTFEPVRPHPQRNAPATELTLTPPHSRTQLHAPTSASTHEHRRTNTHTHTHTPIHTQRRTRRARTHTNTRTHTHAYKQRHFHTHAGRPNDANGPRERSLPPPPARIDPASAAAGFARARPPARAGTTARRSPGGARWSATGLPPTSPS